MSFIIIHDDDFINVFGVNSYPKIYTNNKITFSDHKLDIVLSKSGFIDAPKNDVMFFMQRVWDIIISTQGSMKKDLSYKNHSYYILSFINNIEFCDYKCIYNNIKNVKSHNQLLDALRELKAFIYNLALFIFKKPIQNTFCKDKN